MSRPFVIELTREEAETAWNAMEYAFEALDGDMSLDSEERTELRELDELKDRIKEQLDTQKPQNEYGDAFNEQAGRPTEAIDTMIGSLRGKGGM